MQRQCGCPNKHQNRKPLIRSADRYPALEQKPYDKINPPQQAPGKNDKISDLVRIPVLKKDNSIRKSKYQLMQIICKNKTKSKLPRNIPEASAFSWPVSFGLSNVWEQHSSQKRNEHHWNIIGIPAVTVYPAVMQQIASILRRGQTARS